MGQLHRVVYSLKFIARGLISSIVINSADEYRHLLFTRNKLGSTRYGPCNCVRRPHAQVTCLMFNTHPTEVSFQKSGIWAIPALSGDATLCSAGHFNAIHTRSTFSSSALIWSFKKNPAQARTGNQKGTRGPLVLAHWTRAVQLNSSSRAGSLSKRPI
jgi:hypothetical protein